MRNGVISPSNLIMMEFLQSEGPYLWSRFSGEYRYSENVCGDISMSKTSNE